MLTVIASPSLCATCFDVFFLIITVSTLPHDRRKQAIFLCCTLLTQRPSFSCIIFFFNKRTDNSFSIEKSYCSVLNLISDVCQVINIIFNAGYWFKKHMILSAWSLLLFMNWVLHVVSKKRYIYFVWNAVRFRYKMVLIDAFLFCLPPWQASRCLGLLQLEDFPTKLRQICFFSILLCSLSSSRTVFKDSFKRCYREKMITLIGL